MAGLALDPRRAPGAPRHLAGARTRSPLRYQGDDSADGGTTLTWRGDIQGLRGVAVLAVVLYHAHASYLPGGFAGVDVFYVISGFLITGLLVRELERTGRISLRQFYARRMRRLLPMALVVVVATVVVADLVQSPLDAAQTAKDGLASALYVANYRFALEQTNYLDAAVSASPFQHYWSLGVEEQMYLIWPLLLIAAAGVWWTRRMSVRRCVVVLAIGTLASFAFCVRLTHTNEPWAFFSFPTRAWEAGVGALLAFAAPALRTAHRALATALGVLGLAAVVWSFVEYGASTPWPGDAAAIPVLGAAAIIAAGCARGAQVSNAVLAFPPLQFAGRISYSWYLWHWPVLVLAPLVLKHALTTGEALGLAGASGVLATASYFLVEQPFHRSAWISERAHRGLQLGAGLSLMGAAACWCSISALALPSASLASRPTLLPANLRVADTQSDPDVALLSRSTQIMQSELLASQGVEDVPEDLTPSLAGTFGDDPVLYNDGCVDAYTSIEINSCTYGDPTSSTNVVLFGDSHAAMWFPAVEQAALQYSWKLYAWTKDTCPPVNLTIFSPDLDRTYTECDEWRDEVLSEIAALHPALVILGVARHYTPNYGFTMYSPQWMNALAQMIEQIRALGSKVIVLGPIPKPAVDVPSCLSENLNDATQCETLRGAGVNLPGMREEEAIARDAGASYVNTLFWFCSTSQVCPPIIEDVLVYRDDNHITATFASYLSAPLEAALDLAETGETSPGSAVFLPPTPGQVPPAMPTTTSTIPTGYPVASTPTSTSIVPATLPSSTTPSNTGNTPAGNTPAGNSASSGTAAPSGAT